MPEETDEELDRTPPPRRRRLRRKTADPSCTLRCSCCNIPNSYSTIKSRKDCNGDLLCGSCETFYDCGYCNSTICRLCYTIHPDRCNRQNNHQPTTLEFDIDIQDYIGDGTVTLPQPDNDQHYDFQELFGFPAESALEDSSSTHSDATFINDFFIGDTENETNYQNEFFIGELSDLDNDDNESNISNRTFQNDK